MEYEIKLIKLENEVILLKKNNLQLQYENSLIKETHKKI